MVKITVEAGDTERFKFPSGDPVEIHFSIYSGDSSPVVSFVDPHSATFNVDNGQYIVTAIAVNEDGVTCGSYQTEPFAVGSGPSSFEDVASGMSISWTEL